MTIRERIKSMIRRAEDRGGSDISDAYWDGYKSFGQELLLHVRPKDKE